MDRKTFLRALCGAGACSCLGAPRAIEAAMAPAEQAPDQRLVLARHHLATLANALAAGPAVPAAIEAIEQVGRECARLGGTLTTFAGKPDAYFAEIRKAWGTDFQWDKARGVVRVTVAAGPCECPLVDTKKTPAFWCHCSVGYQKAQFSAIFERPVEATLVESKLAGSARCVFEVRVGQAVPEA